MDEERQQPAHYVGSFERSMVYVTSAQSADNDMDIGVVKRSKRLRSMSALSAV